MLLSADLGAFKAAVLAATRAAEPKNIIPILSNIQINAAPGETTIVCSDNAKFVRIRTEAHVSDGGSILVNAKRLADFLNSAHGSTVSMESTASRLNVKTAGARASLPIDPSKYVDPPKAPEKLIAEVESSYLEDLINTTKIASDISSYGSTECIWFQAHNGTLGTAATDGKVLASCFLPAEPGSFYMLSSNMVTATGVLSGHIKIYEDSNHMIFDDGTICLWIRRSVNSSLDIKRVLKRSPARFVADCDSLLAAAKIAQGFCESTIQVGSKSTLTLKRVIVKVLPGGGTISSSNKDGECSADFRVKGRPAEASMLFNLETLNDIVRACKSAEVEFGWEGKAPISITPVGQPEKLFVVSQLNG